MTMSRLRHYTIWLSRLVQNFVGAIVYLTRHCLAVTRARQAVAPTIMLIALLVLSGCGTRDPNATAIVMFPSSVPIGGLPTASAGGGLIFATSSVPTAIPTVFNPNFTQSAFVTNTPRPAPVFVTATPRVATAIPFVAVTATPIPARPTNPPPTAVPTIDANWNTLANGVVWREIQFRAPATSQVVSLLVTRIDPNLGQIKVHYFNGESRALRDWITKLPGALIIANGSRYDAQGRPQGLFATETVLYGRALGRNDTGFFQVVNAVPRVRSLFVQPFVSNERFDQLIESYPMMMVGGQTAPAYNPDIDQTPDFRTLIGQDRYGRVVIMATRATRVTMSDLTLFLRYSGLELVNVMYLNGGAATNMYLAVNNPVNFTPGTGAFPVAIAVYRR